MAKTYSVAELQAAHKNISSSNEDFSIDELDSAAKNIANVPQGLASSIQKNGMKSSSRYPMSIKKFLEQEKKSNATSHDFLNGLKGAAEGIVNIPYGLNSILHLAGVPMDESLRELHKITQPTSEAGKFGYGMAEEAPILLASEILGPMKIGAKIASKLSHSGALARTAGNIAGTFAPRVAGGALANASTSEDANPIDNLISGGINGLLGIVGDILPRKAINVFSKVKRAKKQETMGHIANEDIAEASENYPDIGRQIDDPELQHDWQKLHSVPTSSSKKIEDEFMTARSRRTRGSIKYANRKSEDLLNKLSGSMAPEDLNDVIQNEIKGALKTHEKRGNELYKDVKEKLDGRTISPKHAALATPAIKTQLKKAGGDISNDFKERLEEIMDYGKKGKPNMYNRYSKKSISDVVELERDLASKGADLRGQMKDTEASYHNKIAKSLLDAQNESLKGSSAESAVKKARKHWHENVIPFKNSRAVRAITENKYDDNIFSENIAKNLTNDSKENMQILKALPQSTRDKLGAALLADKLLSKGDEEKNLSHWVKSSFGANNQKKLKMLIGHDDIKTVNKIKNIVLKNKAGLGDQKPTKLIKDSDHHFSHSLLMNLVNSMKKIPKIPTASYEAELLSEPSVLDKFIFGKKTKIKMPKVTGGRIALKAIGASRYPLNANNNSLPTKKRKK